MEAAQCRMARAALQIGVRELAKIAKVSTDTIVRFERGEELKERTVDALRSTLESSKLLAIQPNGVLITVPLASLSAKAAAWKSSFETQPA